MNIQNQIHMKLLPPGFNNSLKAKIRNGKDKFILILHVLLIKIMYKLSLLLSKILLLEEILIEWDYYNLSLRRFVQYYSKFIYYPFYLNSLATFFRLF